MEILKELSRKEFQKRFGETEQCLSFLASNKWSSGYQCLKCKKEKYSKGKQNIADAVQNVAMMSLQQQILFFIKLNLE